MGHERCDGCGFDGARMDDQSLLDGLHRLGPAWAALLAGAGDELRVRPAPSTWSAIEYAAHSRDITALHVWAVEQALGGDEPLIPEAAGDDLIQAAAASYGAADPRAVAEALGGQADRLADLARDAGRGSWGRGITVGGSRSDVRRLLEHALHDSRHHLDYGTRGLPVLRSA